MSLPTMDVLTINGGSSSIKFALYQTGDVVTRRLVGKIDRIGQSETRLTFSESGVEPSHIAIDAADYRTAANWLLDWLDQHGLAQVGAVGHRVVHGMERSQPERITQDLIDALWHISACDPDHLPREIELIEAFRDRTPDLPQVACFDTAFHAGLPRVAQLLPIPRRFLDRGIRRYGFHGLSYAYLMQALARIAGADVAHGRVILAHLGSGASLAALRDGHIIDTSMGFTPSSGLMMGTRCGDIDPGVAWYLMQNENLSTKQFNEFINHQCGLLGVSAISADMRDLLAHEATDARAAEAIALFCYQTKKWLGAYAAALGGLDTLVFAGGIGENVPAVRARICTGLEFLGVEIAEEANATHADIISAPTSRVTVRIIPTDEEAMIVQAVVDVLNVSIQKE
jgi:acetate kinase